MSHLLMTYRFPPSTVENPWFTFKVLKIRFRSWSPFGSSGLVLPFRRSNAAFLRLNHYAFPMSFTLGYFCQTIRSFIKKYSTLEIYTDGSCKDGFGSWAYIISRRGKIICERAGSVQGTSSIMMEFQAALEALSSLSVKSTITVFSDSKILVDAMTIGNSHTSFQNQMEKLKPLCYKHNVKWQWIKAHNGNKFNERCDELCTLIRGN